jgi:lysozyme
MKISANGLAIVKAFEGCLKKVPGKPGYFKPYVCPAGVLTIGWGHTNHHKPKFNESAVWSQDQCDAVLVGDMGTFERHVEKNAQVILAQHEFDALVSWAYNTGGPSHATVWKHLNAGRRKKVGPALKAWNKANGQVLNGLVRRRNSEAALFDGNIEEALKIAGAKKPTDKPISKPSPAPKPDTKPAVQSKEIWATIGTILTTILGIVTDWRVLSVLVVGFGLFAIYWRFNKDDIRGWFS